jgi:hypothetical protein
MAGLMRTVIAAALIAGASLGPARAVPIPQMACDRAVLLDAAHEILDRRGELSNGPGRFFARRLGGDAGYLSLRYGSRPVADVLASLDRERAFGLREELRLARLIALSGADGLAAWGQDPAEVLAGAHVHVWRAILLLDGGETFFRLLAEVRQDPDLNRAFDEVWQAGRHLRAAVLDQPPRVLRAIAERAEAAGELGVAGQLFALIPDKTDYFTFVDRHGAETLRAWRVAPLMMSGTSVVVLSQAEPLLPLDDAEPEVRAFRTDLHDIGRATRFEAGTQVLAIVMNQSGLLAESADVARRLSAAVDAGEVTPRRRPEEAWAALLAAYRASPKARAFIEVLGRIGHAADKRHYSGTMLEVLQMATAVEAASPWLRGAVAEPPDRPAVLDASFDWDRMVGIWARLRAGADRPDLSGDRFQTMAAIEGLIQRGEIARALDLAERTGGLADRLFLARDVMTRQNRLCDAHGIMPGEALFLGGQILCDFQ